MSNRNFDTDYCIGKRLICISGSFVPVNSGSVAASTVRGYGFGYAPNSSGVMTLQPNVASKNFLTTTPGISRTGTGLYTITFEDPYIDCNAVSVDWAPTAASPNWAQPLDPVANLGSSTQAPVLSIQIVNNSGSATDVNTGRIYFEIVFRDSTVQRAKP